MSQPLETTSSLNPAIDTARVIPALAVPGWRRNLANLLNSMLGLPQVERLFRKVENEENVYLSVLENHGVTLDDGALRQSIPRQGAAIVLANHPFGGADALALSGVCLSQRPDTKVMANSLVAALPGLSKTVIPLRIMGEEGSTRMNRDAMKESMAHLRSGGVLVVFPAGAVSRWRHDLARVADLEWSPHIARLAMKLKLPVLPVRFFGRSPVWFELLGAIHPLVRSALIIRVFLSFRGGQLLCRPGKLLEASWFNTCSDAEEATRLLRQAVETIREP